MSGKKATLYLKIEQSALVSQPRVCLKDIGTLTCSDSKILRELMQLQIYYFQTFSEKKRKKGEILQTFSVMAVIRQIQEEFPDVDVENLGEADFIVRYDPGTGEKKVVEWLKLAALCVIVFFGAAFAIMAFNNDISITELFGNIYRQVLGQESNGFTELEISYCIGLPIGVLLFFNHFGKYKLSTDPTPIAVEMRNYEKDADATLIENAQRGGRTIDVD
ncbi:MAG: stage V sporulation protein AA [Lachnospiraceae bacterium]|nr:stage V sporulation protein AA [Lachnospiraceae bacterium]